MSSNERVQAGKTVCLDYTLCLADGTLVDSAQHSGTWTYVHGHTRMPPGLHTGVEGLGIGDTVRLELEPADAFGRMSTRQPFRNSPRNNFPLRPGTSASRANFRGRTAASSPIAFMPLTTPR